MMPRFRALRHNIQQPLEIIGTPSEIFGNIRKLLGHFRQCSEILGNFFGKKFGSHEYENLTHLT